MSGAPPSADPTSTLIYLYGPPASGKLTIAEHAAAVTGFRLFHNHLSVTAVRSAFEFNSAPYTEVLHRLRLDIFATAARAHHNLIFTNNSWWAGDDGDERFRLFTETARQHVESNGGRVLFVRIVAPLAVLEERVVNESRHAHGKLLDAVHLRAMSLQHSEHSLHNDDLVIDSSLVTPDVAAQVIANELEKRRAVTHDRDAP